MIETVIALAPVGLVIALGWALKQWSFPGDGFWGPAERVTYYILMPSLIVGNLAAAPSPPSISRRWSPFWRRRCWSAPR